MNITYNFRVKRNCVPGVESFVASLYEQASYKLAEIFIVLVSSIAQVLICRFMLMDNNGINSFTHAPVKLVSGCFKLKDKATQLGQILTSNILTYIDTKDFTHTILCPETTHNLTNHSIDPRT